MEDTKNLNSEESSDAVKVAPETLDGQDILANLYQNNDIPKLPFPIDILLEKEAGAWLLPELKKVYISQKGFQIVFVFLSVTDMMNYL